MERIFKGTLSARDLNEYYYIFVIKVRKMLKEFFDTDKISLKVGRILAKLPITPNQWTLISLVPAVIGFYFAMEKMIIEAFFSFLVAGVLDGVDGGVARAKGCVTKFGAFLDGSIDRIVDFLLIFSFLFFELKSEFLMPIEYWIVVLAYFCLMPTFEVAYANHRQAVKDPNEKVIWRIMHRTEIYPMLLLAMLLANFSKSLCFWVLILTTILCIITTVQTIVLTYIKSRRYR